MGESGEQSAVLDEFGLDVMANARDETMLWIEKVIEGRGRTPHLVQLHEELSSLSPEGLEAARHLARWATDLCIHNFLRMFEHSERFDIAASEGSTTHSLREVSDGLSGELYTEDGWFSRFSEFEAPAF